MSYLKPGTKLCNDQYEIIRMYAHGGFGIIYEAQEIGHITVNGYGDKKYVAHRGDKVAIKELYYENTSQRNQHTNVVTMIDRKEQTDFDKLVNKLLDEGNMLRSLDHKNIVRTRDIFKENGTAYMVMDFIEGETLEAMLNKSGKLSKEKVFNYFRQLLAAMEVIHAKKILHLDIKPCNILINKNDEAILIDFGASLAYDDNGDLKVEATKISGMTELFSPTEQKKIENLRRFDPAFDIYSSGATLYNLLTNLPPSKQNIDQQLASVINSVSDYIDAVISKVMMEKAEERLSSIVLFREHVDLEEAYVQRANAVKQANSEDELVLSLKIIEEMELTFLSTKTMRDYRHVIELLNWDARQRPEELLVRWLKLEKEKKELQDNYMKSQTEAAVLKSENEKLKLKISLADVVAGAKNKVTSDWKINSYFDDNGRGFWLGRPEIILFFAFIFVLLVIYAFNYHKN